MYLHLGQEVLIKKDDIIGIFDMDKATVSARTRRFLAQKEKEHKVVYVTADLPKSFILCGRGKEMTVYVSQISAQTLLKRCNFIQKLSYI